MNDTADENPLRASFRDLLLAECGPQAVVDHAAGRHDLIPDLWRTITDLGWTALGIDEMHGGLGLGMDAQAMLYQELGRAVAPLPYLATSLAADAIARAGDVAQQTAWLPQIAGGMRAAASAPATLVPPTLRLSQAQGAWVLSGRGAFLPDAVDATLLVLLAQDAEGTWWRICVEPAADGVEVRSRPTWDRTRTLAEVTFDGWRVPDGRVMASNAAVEDALAVHASLALAADAIGGADAALTHTIDYLKTRHQFGRAIGSFQALKHRVADHRTQIVAGKALLDAAVALAATGDDGAAAEASAAKALICSNFADIARDCIQLHGGIGFTMEHPIHLYLNRARLSLALFGARDVHLTRANAGLMAATA